MIYTHSHIRRDLRLSADVCVIGSGAGGAPVALEAARAGKRVVVLEAGSFFRPRDFTQLEHEMFPRLYHENAGRTTSDKAIHVHQGKGVGGSTLHNLNLCARVPEVLFSEWRRRFGLSTLTAPVVDGLYTDVERIISVSQVTDGQLGANSRILKRGCEALGYRGGYLHHNRVGCAESGFCELGCPFDAKQNALKVFITPAVEAGATVVADTWVTGIEISGLRAGPVRAETRNPDGGGKIASVTVDAEVVCVSASATATPSLLQRSEVPDPHELVGSRIHLHPGVAVAGIFDRALRSWAGIPQGYECTELLDLSPGSPHRVWIIPAFAHPAGVSAILSGFGAEHARYMALYPQMAALSPMVHDETAGTVSPRGRFGVEVDYWLDEPDQAQLRLGIMACARLLFAAGATRVLIPLARTLELDSADQVDPALGTLEIRKHDLDITSVHPMSSVWMGDDPARSCVDSAGRYHHLENLFVADTSLFPTSIGGPPQLTAFALGLHVGRQIVGFLA